jgi:molybdopterin/thiamine biosynthesis adenylyltransferase
MKHFRCLRSVRKDMDGALSAPAPFGSGIRLSGYVRVVADDTKVYFAGDVVLAFKRSSAVVNFARALKKGIPLRELTRFRNNGLSRVITLLEKHQLVHRIAFNSTKLATDYDCFPNSLEFFEARGVSPSRWRRAIDHWCIAIVGVGGIGGMALLHLLGSGFRNYVLCDPDIVAKPNLNRQFCFRPDDIGQLKVEVLRKLIRGYWSDANVAVSRTFVTSEAELERLPLVANRSILILGADHPPNIDAITEEFCTVRQIPLVTGGCRGDTGSWGRVVHRGVLSPKSVVFRGEIDEICSKGTASLSTINSIVAARVAHRVIEFALGIRDSLGTGVHREQMAEPEGKKSKNNDSDDQPSSHHCSSAY